MITKVPEEHVAFIFRLEVEICSSDTLVPHKRLSGVVRTKIHGHVSSQTVSII